MNKQNRNNSQTHKTNRWLPDKKGLRGEEKEVRETRRYKLLAAK